MIPQTMKIFIVVVSFITNGVFSFLFITGVVVADEWGLTFSFVNFLLSFLYLAFHWLQYSVMSMEQEAQADIDATNHKLYLKFLQRFLEKED